MEKRMDLYKSSQLKRKLKYVGNNVEIGRNVKIINPEFVSIGDDTRIDDNTIIIACPSNIMDRISYRKLKVPENYQEQIKRYNIDIGEVIIGKNCHIGYNNMIFGYGGVLISDYFTTSPDVKIYSLNSLSNDPFDKGIISYVQPYTGESPTEMGPVVLGENSWLAIGVVVLPNTIVEKNCFITAYSIFSGYLEENKKVSTKRELKITNRFTYD